MEWNASWIWHPAGEGAENFYLHARKTFALDRAPGGARIYVTAGSLYKLYVNGQYVGRGPNPADPSYYYYDVHDVTSLLQKGENVIAATCYAYGPKSHGVINQNWDRGGFLLEMRGVDGNVLLGTDASWRVLPADEWDRNAPVNCNLLGDFKETYDSRREIVGWQKPGFDDSKWARALLLGKPPLEPYTHLVEREIPFLGGERVFPVEVFWESASVTYSWRDDWEFYHEQRLVGGNPGNATTKPVEAFKTHDDFEPSLILDFGRLVTGYPEIVVVDGAGGEIDVLYGEQLFFTRVDRFILKGGPQTLQAYNRRTFRYMKLLFKQTPKKILLDRVSVDMSTYPVKYTGSFACSDDMLNRIWDVSRYTIHLSMLDHFVDCPWRERTIYGGDIYAENLISAYAFGDPRLNAKTLRQMFAIQYAEGAVPVLGPYSGVNHFYPSWTAFTALAFIDHFLLTADESFARELWPRFTRLLDWAAGQVENNRPHLIGDPAEGGAFESWMQRPKVRFGAWGNLPFYAVLKRGAELARTLGDFEHAKRCAAAADLMAADIRKYQVGADGLFKAHPDGQADHGPMFNNGLLVWSDVLEESDAGKALNAMFDRVTEPDSCPFHGLFIVESLFKHRRGAMALDYMRQYWGEMIRRGATTFWEHFSLAMPPGRAVSRLGSLCHGWSAGPAYSLPAHVLGVQAMEPGFAKVLIEPQPGDLNWARGIIPTPHGLVDVDWTKSGEEFSMNVRLPAGRSAIVSLPFSTLHARVAVDGKTLDAKRDGDRVVFEIPSGDHDISYR